MRNSRDDKFDFDEENDDSDVHMKEFELRGKTSVLISRY